MIPDPAVMSAEWTEVAEELCREPLGKALWDRAQAVVLLRRQQSRIAQLEAAQAAPTESQSPSGSQS
jgi:hypothetical protein